MTTFPALYVSHGSPMVLLTDTPARDFLAGFGRELGKPRAIVIATAHFETRRPVLTADEHPDMIYDFGGFPRPLFEMKYPAPGAPAAYLGSFIMVGVGMSILGPSLRRLAEVTGSTEATLGILFTTASIGYLAGITIGGRLIVRRSGHAILVGGLVIMTAGAVAVPFARTVTSLIVAEFVLGLATGLVEVPCNSLILWTHGGGALLNALHACWSVGAVIAPLVVGASIAVTGGLPAAYLVVAATTLVPLVALRGRRSPPNPHHEVGHGIPDSSRRLVVIGACFYVAYIGIQAGFAGWIYTFAEDRGLTGATATLLGAAFLGTFAVGRLVSIPIAVRVDPRRVLLVDHAIVFVGLGVLLVSGRSSALIWAGTVILDRKSTRLNSSH